MSIVIEFNNPVILEICLTWHVKGNTSTPQFSMIGGTFQITVPLSISAEEAQIALLGKVAPAPAGNIIVIFLATNKTLYSTYFNYWIRIRFCELVDFHRALLTQNGTYLSGG